MFSDGRQTPWIGLVCSIVTRRKPPNVAPVGKAPPIPTKDQKILWARAAGLCSFAVCHDHLTLDGAAGGGVLVLGEMCHIVGESENGPRGTSPLPLKDRSEYSNLILLCAKHHTVIDKDIARYPIEVLHATKAAHEQWVAETLSRRSPEPDPDELVYADLIDTITSALQLDSWSWFIDAAVRDILDPSFVEARGVLNKKSLSILWPKKRLQLESKAKDLIRSFSDYVTFFISNAELRGPRESHFTADHSFARYPNPNRHAYEEYEDVWSGACFWLLCDFTSRLNSFCASVRASMNPLYFRLQGDFLIEDPMGYRNSMQPTFYKPARALIQRHLAKARLEEASRAQAIRKDPAFPASP